MAPHPMTAPAIREALEKAASVRVVGRRPDEDAWADAVQESAEEIAAFLRAPIASASTLRLHMGELSAQELRAIRAYHRWLAAAVEQARKEATDG